jgi:hypothetical protein
MRFGFKDARTGDEKELAAANGNRADIEGVIHADQYRREQR